MTSLQNEMFKKRLAELSFGDLIIVKNEIRLRLSRIQEMMQEPNSLSAEMLASLKSNKSKAMDLFVCVESYISERFDYWIETYFD